VATNALTPLNGASSPTANMILGFIQSINSSSGFATAASLSVVTVSPVVWLRKS